MVSRASEGGKGVPGQPLASASPCYCTEESPREREHSCSRSRGAAGNEEKKRKQFGTVRTAGFLRGGRGGGEEMRSSPRLFIARGTRLHLSTAPRIQMKP